MELEEQRMREEELRAQAEEDKRRSEEDRLRAEADKQREYDELIAYAKDYVGKDPVVVASVFKDWLAQSAGK